MGRRCSRRPGLVIDRAAGREWSDMAEPMQVEVVSADRVVWSGKSSNIIAKTVEGEIGILPGHEPVLGVLVPSAVVIFCERCRRGRSSLWTVASSPYRRGESRS